MTKRRIRSVKRILVTLMLIVFTGFFTANAQNVYERIYANSQDSGGPALGSGTITNANLAVDNNLQTASKVSCSALLGSQTKWQEVTFSAGINKSIPINIKFSTEVAVNVLGDATVTLETYNGSNAVGLPLTLTSGILGLVGGVNMIDYQMPAPGGSGTYNKIRITLTVSGVATSGSVGIYEAYYTKTLTTSFACNSIVDYLHGITGGALLSGTNEVLNPQLAVDRNKTTNSILRANVSVAASAFETAIYNATSKPGDSIKITFKSGSNGLLDLSLLSSNLNVTAYRNNTAVTTLADQSPLLKLSLLAPGSDIQVLRFPVSDSFDRIRVSIGQGVANVLSSLLLYEIERIAPRPIISATGLNGGIVTACFGNPVTLTISNPETGSVYKWFDAETNGNEITAGVSQSGVSFTTTNLPVGNKIYYVSVVRSGCTDEASERAKVQITVNPLPTATIAGTASVCQSAPVPNVVFTGANGTAPYQFSYTINSGAIKTISTSSGNSVSVPVPNELPGPYIYTLLSVKDNGVNQCSQTQTGSATVTITAKPQPPSLTINVNN
jgi:hypothetical protein